jgi:RNA polymerase sigma-54 factor
MALSAKLQARQTQSLVITPQLMQAIRLLGMSSLELDSFIAGEIEQNPLLEREEAVEVAEPSPEPAGMAEDGPGEPPAGDCAGNGADGLQETGERSDEEFGWRAPSGSPGTATSEWQDFGNDPGLTATVSLAEMLERKIEAAFAAAPADRLVASALLSALDECGYLAEPLEEIAARLGAPLPDAERVLRICQELAPAGIFARSLRECLGLQLAEQGRLDPAMQALLENLHHLAAGDRIALCNLCGVDRDDLDDMIAEIRALDPKPGLAFEHEPVRSLVPDVFVRLAPEGSWTVELNDDALPRILVNRVYIAEVSSSARSETERRYLTECLQKASWLEKSLDQRAKTVLRVAAEIVRHQQGFLANGMGYLRPLNLRMVADTLGVHESTVSRAAANKTISTPRGVFDFRDFFSGSIPDSSGGEAHSAQAVKHRIRRLIGEESPDAILSDDALVAQLSREGIEIARRTVAKYRELMRIGSSVERRREKRLRAAS